MVLTGVSPDLDLDYLRLNSNIRFIHTQNFHCCRSQRELTIAINQLQEAVNMGALIPIESQYVRGLSKFFLAFNGKTPRVVVHPKHINISSRSPVAVAYEDLRIIRRHIFQGARLTSIDLKKAYWQIPIASWLIPYTAIRMQHQCFAWRSLILGLNFAPAVFTMITQVLMSALRSWGICVFRYIDDLLIISQMHTAQTDLRSTFLLLRTAGFVCNIQKSVLVPSQCIQHLGLLIDSEHMCFRIPHQKVVDISNLARALSQKTTPRAESIAKLIGKLVSVTLASSIAHRSIWNLVKDLYTTPHPWGQKIILSEGSRTTLAWIANNLQALASRSILPRTALVVLTDASDWGAGIYIPASGVCRSFQWQFGPQPHIMIREMWAVLLSLPLIPKGSIIAFITDNAAVHSYLRKGGHKCQELMELAQLLWVWLAYYQLEVEATYWLPSRLNIVADALSRARPCSIVLLDQQCSIMLENFPNYSDGYIIGN